MRIENVSVLYNNEIVGIIQTIDLDIAKGIIMAYRAVFPEEKYILVEQKNCFDLFCSQCKIYGCNLCPTSVAFSGGGVAVVDTSIIIYEKIVFEDANANL
jgi:hypothetical protein